MLQKIRNEKLDLVVATRNAEAEAWGNSPAPGVVEQSGATLESVGVSY